MCIDENHALNNRRASESLPSASPLSGICDCTKLRIKSNDSGLGGKLKAIQNSFRPILCSRIRSISHISRAFGHRAQQNSVPQMDRSELCFPIQKANPRSMPQHQDICSSWAGLRRPSGTSPIEKLHAGHGVAAGRARLRISARLGCSRPTACPGSTRRPGAPPTGVARTGLGVCDRAGPDSDHCHYWPRGSWLPPAGAADGLPVGGSRRGWALRVRGWVRQPAATRRGARTHARTHAPMYTRTRARARARTHTHTPRDPHTHTHTHTRTPARTRTHAHTQHTPRRCAHTINPPRSVVANAHFRAPAVGPYRTVGLWSHKEPHVRELTSVHDLQPQGTTRDAVDYRA